MTVLRCWRCDRKLLEVSPETKGMIILPCVRCGAKNQYMLDSLSVSVVTSAVTA